MRRVEDMTIEEFKKATEGGQEIYVELVHYTISHGEDIICGEDAIGFDDEYDSFEELIESIDRCVRDPYNEITSTGILVADILSKYEKDEITINILFIVGGEL